MEPKTFDQIVIFTDGSCSNNGRINAKAGIGIHYPNGEFLDISEPFLEPPITNQRAELFAIFKALNLVTKNAKFNKIFIYSDSLYSIKCLTVWIMNWEKNNWKSANKKPIKNLDIIKPIHDILLEFNDKIIFKHVKAHTKKEDYESINNAKADELAFSAMIKNKNSSKII